MNQQAASNTAKEMQNIMIGGGMSTCNMRVFICHDVSPHMRRDSPECGSLINSTANQLMAGKFNSGGINTLVCQVYNSGVTVMQELSSDKNNALLTKSGAYDLAVEIWDVFLDFHAAMNDLTATAKQLLEGNPDANRTLH